MVVGRIALGRIFNVVGSIIDRYMEFSNSCQFNTTKLYEALLVIAVGDMNQPCGFMAQVLSMVSFRHFGFDHLSPKCVGHCRLASMYSCSTAFPIKARQPIEL